MNDYNQNMGKTIAEIFSGRYVIPLYQRNFAWRTEEIHQLLQDIYEACRKNPNGNYYIGSLVVMKRHNGDYEVIDGQQRLTVISLIAMLLKDRKGEPVLSRPVLFYDSRPEVQEFFELLCKNQGKPEDALRLAAPSLFYLKEACEFLKTAKADFPDLPAGSEEHVQYLADPQFAEFFLNHVVLVRNEMSEDTDVAAYFEIMNNRGEQLQKHEIVKARMMDKIKVVRPDVAECHDTVRQSLFAQIWDACSQMDVPIQRLFSAENRRQFFGDGYDGFTCNINNGSPSSVTASGETPYSLKDILEGRAQVFDSNEKRDEVATETDVYSYASIIDFPNFLMHVLRLYLVKIVKMREGLVNEKVPLNEKHLLSAYQQQSNNINSMEFVKLLLFCRTVFDRFIVKTMEDSTDQEDGRKWVLLKPTKYEKRNWKFTSSFEGEKEKQLVAALSMLQVTFRTRIYKTWLYEVLKWLYDVCGVNGNLIDVSADAYMGFLHRWMLDYYNGQEFQIPRIPDDETPSKSNSYSLGTATPHFLLNFIDYLYCCQSPKKYLGKFEFKYWNSVEHHLAQNKKEGCSFIDNLGNLCLISKSSNSRLSDRDVKEKVELCGNGNLGPNRQIIYAVTKSELGKEKWFWGEKQIRDHYNEIVELLKKRREILCPLSTEECCHVDITDLGEFIELNYFDVQLPNGGSLELIVNPESKDAEVQGKWCGRYFDLACDRGNLRGWVGWVYGVGVFQKSPQFIVQIEREGFIKFTSNINTSGWYLDEYSKTEYGVEWMTKNLSSSLDSLQSSITHFKREIEFLCSHGCC